MISENYLKDSISQFRKLKTLAEKALSRISEKDFFKEPGPESNSVAIIVKHISGNLRSRWQDFLLSDGEKPDRYRDTEFELTSGESRESIMNKWENGWQTLFETAASLKPQDLSKTITIRGEPHTVVEAINRQINHNAYHVGQIVYLAKHYAGGKWKTLSIPRGKSEEFTRRLRDKFK